MSLQPEDKNHSITAFGLSVACDPLIVEREKKVTISVWQPSLDSGPSKPAVIEVRDKSGNVVHKNTIALRAGKHPPQVVKFKMDRSLQPGQYEVHAYYAESTMASVLTFELVMPGFGSKAKKLTIALDLQRSAVELKEQRNLPGAAQILNESARILSNLGCYDLASSALRDLAALQLFVGNKEDTELSVRSGLLQVLHASCVRANAHQSRPSGDQTASDLVTLRTLQIRHWQTVDFFELLTRMNKELVIPKQIESGFEVVRELVRALVDLGESSTFFLRILEANIDDREFAGVCYLGLSKDNGRRAIRLIPRVLTVADLQKDFDPESSLMQAVIAASDPVDLYRNLPALLRKTDKERCRSFLGLLNAIVPARWMFSHQQCFVYLGAHPMGNAIVIANTDSNLRPLLPSASTATFADAESRVMKATA